MGPAMVLNQRVHVDVLCPVCGQTPVEDPGRFASALSLRVDPRFAKPTALSAPCAAWAAAWAAI